jgi:hypothetical protein
MRSEVDDQAVACRDGAGADVISGGDPIDEIVVVSAIMVEKTSCLAPASSARRPPRSHRR